MKDPLVVNPEKVRIQPGLQESRQDNHQLSRVTASVAVDPVEEVAEAVEAEGKEVVGGDGFGFAGFLELEHLGQDGDGFQ